jgi:Zn-dependent protease with chaperone function
MRVARRLSQVNQIDGLRLFVIEDDTQENAFVSSGGTVLVYSGLIKLMETDDQLAVVLAHEMAHYVARHNTERTAVEWLRNVLDYITSSREGDAVQYVAADNRSTSYH